MILGFDIDGVLYPWHEEVWKWFVNRNGMNISFIDFWKYPDGFISMNEGTALVKALVKETLPYISAKASQADVSVVHDIAKFFDEVYYITSRPEGLHYDTSKWLKDNEFPFADNLIMADGNGGKVSVVAEVGCDYYVEDRPKYLDTLPAVTTVIKMTRPYNRYEDFHVDEVGNLVELYQYFERELKHD